MKKNYTTPSAELVEFNYTEVVTASGPYWCWCCKPVSNGSQVTGGTKSSGGDQENCQQGESYWVPPVPSNATPYWGGC